MTAMDAACSAASGASLDSLGRTTAVPPAVRRGAWQLKAGQALALHAQTAHVLSVRQGRLWVTMDATRNRGSEDLVLAPGESLHVPAGQRLVMEPWDGWGATWCWEHAPA